MVTLADGTQLEQSLAVEINGQWYNKNNNDIVFLSRADKYYLKSDPAIVYVRNKWRRKSSLTLCSDGEYETRDYTRRLHDGTLVSTDRTFVIEYTEGVYYRSEDIFICPTTNRRILLPDIATDSFGVRGHKDEMVTLLDLRKCAKHNARKLISEYGDNMYGHRAGVEDVYRLDGNSAGLILHSDTDKYTELYLSARRIIEGETTKVLKSLITDADPVTAVMLGDIAYPVLSSKIEVITRDWNDIMEEIRDSEGFSGRVVTASHLRVSETFQPENNAKSVPVGKNTHSRTELTLPIRRVLEIRDGKPYKTGRTEPLLSFLKTDGIRYSFGVEVEVVAGTIPKAELHGLGVESCHDGSITNKFNSGTEYKIGPLQGDQGLDILRRFLELVNKYCLVDDSCGLHIHIGNANENSTDIIFNRPTIFNLIRLGTKVERNWFELFHHRRYNSKYCKSILEFADIDIEANYNELVGVYIFADSRNTEEIKDINKLTLNHKRNKDTRQTQSYPEARYRWLNLVGIGSKHKQPTVEFRHHPGTTNPDKIMAHLFTCLAFVRIASDRMALMSKCNTVEDIVSSALSKKISEPIVQYYAARRAHFNTDLSVYDFPPLVSRMIDKTKQEPLPTKRKKTGFLALEKTIKDWVNEDYARELDELLTPEGKIYQGHYRIGGFDPYWGNVNLDDIDLAALKSHDTKIYMDYCEATVDLIEQQAEQNS
jgi:hypothetical protein